MNAREFDNIMKSEGLQMSKAVMVMLEEAKQCHKNIKQASMYKHIPRFAQYIDEQMELKDKSIWQALSVAQLEKMYGFKLIEDRNDVIIATYQLSNPYSEAAQTIRNQIQIMMELEKEYAISN